MQPQDLKGAGMPSGMGCGRSPRVGAVHAHDLYRNGAARVPVTRCFGGLRAEETAAALKIIPRVLRDWKLARPRWPLETVAPFPAPKKNPAEVL
jgi:hypothetical protein